MNKHADGSSGRKKHMMPKILLLVTSICLSFLMAEFVLRKSRPPDTGKSYEFRVPHPVYGWVLQAGASYRNYLPEATVRVSYNSEGWRDVEHSKEKSAGVFRILVLGDSFMEAYSVDLESSFHKRVEGMIRKLGVQAELINMGVGGYGTLQEYLVFRQEGIVYSPDIVLLGFYVSNDVTNNSMELEAMLVDVKSEIHSRPFLDPKKTAEWKIIPVDIDGARRRYEQAQSINYPLGKTLTRRSVLLWIVSEEIMRVVNQVSSFFENTSNSDNESERVHIENMRLALSGVHYCNEPPEFTRAWDITKRILFRLKHDVESNGGRLIVFTVPSIDESRVDNEKERVDSSSHAVSGCLKKTAGYNRLHQVLDEVGVELIDLLPEFRRVTKEKGVELFWKSDRHWNSEGHAFAAERVVSELTKMKLLENSDSIPGENNQPGQ